MKEGTLLCHDGISYLAVVYASGLGNLDHYDCMKDVFCWYLDEIVYDLWEYGEASL